MTLPTRKKIAHYWAARQEAGDYELVHEVDTEDLHCFACGSEDTLERAHIIAKQFDGTEKPSNLLLLCRYCHRHCPDVNDRSEVFRWVNERESESAKWVKFVQKGIMLSGISDAQLADINKRTQPSDFLDDLTKLSGIHSNIIKDSTIVAAIASWLRQRAR
jgi:hypothetical protein